MENIRQIILNNIPGVSEAEIFFLETWNELTNDETHTSYRPKVMNLKLILNELITYLEETINGQGAFKYYVEQISNEMESFFLKESILLNSKELFKEELRNIINNLKDFSKRSEKDIQKSYKELIILKKIYMYFDENYEDLLINQLKISIQNDNKKEILIFTSALLTNFISNGLSIKKLYYCRRQLYEWDNKIFSDRFDDAIASLNNSKKWTVYLKIISNRNFQSNYPRFDNVTFYNSIDLSSFTRISELPEVFKEVRPNVKYAKVIVHTSDPHRASLMAKNIVEEILDFIIYTTEPLNVEFYHQSFLLEQNGITDSTLNHFYKHDYLSEFSTEELYSLVNHNNKLNQNSNKRLIASLKFYRMGLTTSIEHVAFTNIWTAFEYLLTGNKANSELKSKLSKEAKIILSLKYISSLLNDIKNNLILFSIPVPLDNKEQWDEVSLNELLLILRNPSPLETLIESIDNSILLKYRISELAQKLINNTSTYEFINEHNKRVEWQLSRLYRVRNVIAHEARKTDITLMLPHLKNYCFLLLETYLTLLRMNSENIQELDDLLIRITNWYEFINIELKTKNNLLPLYELYFDLV